MKLLIIEDNAKFAEGLADNLQDLGYAVDTATEGKRGLEMAKANQYDLLILDLNLPDMDGLDICRHLRALQPCLFIMMLSGRSQLSDQLTGLDAGADDYLVKPFHFDELAARIRALLRRDVRLQGPVLEVVDLKLDPGSCSVWKGDAQLSLTRKEFDILEYLMRHPGEVISQETLLEHVWESNVDPLSNTVRVHISLLRRKLGDDAEKPKYIETVVGRGYRLLAPPQLGEAH